MDTKYRVEYEIQHRDDLFQSAIDVSLIEMVDIGMDVTELIRNGDVDINDLLIDSLEYPNASNNFNVQGYDIRDIITKRLSVTVTDDGVKVSDGTTTEIIPDMYCVDEFCNDGVKWSTYITSITEIRAGGRKEQNQSTTPANIVYDIRSGLKKVFERRHKADVEFARSTIHDMLFDGKPQNIDSFCEVHYDAIIEDADLNGDNTALSLYISARRLDLPKRNLSNILELLSSELANDVFGCLVEISYEYDSNGKEEVELTISLDFGRTIDCVGSSYFLDPKYGKG